MATLEASGTQAATVGTEHTLSTLTVVKTLWPQVDISALAAGEYVEIKVKTITLAAGTSRVYRSAIYSWLDALVTPSIDAPPIVSNIEYVVTLKQINGTGRSFPWKILSP